MNFLSIFFTKQNIINIVLIGFILRIIVLIFNINLNFGDTQTHKLMGEEIFNQQLVTSSIHMPGYGIYIYINNFLLNSEYGFLFMDILISTSSIFLIYLISKKIFKDELISKISAFIFALYPFSIFYSVSGLNETLYIFLLLLSFLNFYERKYNLAIIFIVLSIYVKSISFYIAPILLLTFLIIEKNNLEKIFKFFLKYLLILIIFMSPWWIHNFKKFNAFVPTDLGYGYHLYSGNNIMNETGGGIGGIDVDHQPILDVSDNGKHDYFKADKVFKTEAYKFIIENPKQFLNLSIKKFFRFWRIYPYTNEYNNFFYKTVSIFSFGLILVFSSLFLFLYPKKKYADIIPLLLTVLLFTFIYTITISSIRYRFPIEPLLIILSSYSIKKILFSR